MAQYQGSVYNTATAVRLRWVEQAIRGNAGMTFITISDEQARVIADSTGPIVFVDVTGREVGKLEPIARSANSELSISADELADLRNRMNSPGPGKTTKDLLDHLKSIAPIEPQ